MQVLDTIDVLKVPVYKLFLPYSEDTDLIGSEVIRVGGLNQIDTPNRVYAAHSHVAIFHSKRFL
jgi:hypothetical protein